MYMYKIRIVIDVHFQNGSIEIGDENMETPYKLMIWLDSLVPYYYLQSDIVCVSK